MQNWLKNYLKIRKYVTALKYRHVLIWLEWLPKVPAICKAYLLLVRQMETPVSSMKVAVRRRSSRLPQSLRATGVWSGQIPFLRSS